MLKTKHKHIEREQGKDQRWLTKLFIVRVEVIKMEDD